MNTLTASETQIIQSVKAHLEEEFLSAEASHDWQHVLRVEKNALDLLQQTPQANTFIVLLGVYLHDIADAKFHDGNEEIGPQKTFNLLSHYPISKSIIDEVVFIVKYMSFRSSFQQVEKNLNFQLVQDADRLDAMGAIGIARAFQYGGYKNRKLYSNLPPKSLQSKSEYKKSESATLQHFFEKLLKLKDLMNTQVAQVEAQKRHQFMLLFLNQFSQEIQAPEWFKEALLVVEKEKKSN